MSRRLMCKKQHIARVAATLRPLQVRADDVTALSTHALISQLTAVSHWLAEHGENASRQL